MVSTIFQSSVVADGRERVRWKEQNYATPVAHKANRHVGRRFGNGGPMVKVDSGRPSDGKRAADWFGPGAARSD